MSTQLWVAVAVYSHDRHRTAVTVVAETAELAEVELSREVALQHNPPGWISSLPILRDVHCIPMEQRPFYRDLNDEQRAEVVSILAEDKRDSLDEDAREDAEGMSLEELQDLLDA